MKSNLKVLIAYDGSAGGDLILDDLGGAGLPQEAEAIVLSIYEHWLPAFSSFREVPPGREPDTSSENDPLVAAMRAARHLISRFPGWKVRAETAVGSPGSVIIQRADGWQPDLIVVGAHQRTALGRFFLGSVSQSVLHTANCSVRVARGGPREIASPRRLVVAVDGSQYAAAALDVVSNRQWPAGTEARLVYGSSANLALRYDDELVDLGNYATLEDERMKRVLETVAERLRSTGLIVSTLIERKDPRHLLLREAEKWGADCIFLGARGMGTLERIMLGSVSSSVAVRAHCSVEVVRSASIEPRSNVRKDL